MPRLSKNYAHQAIDRAVAALVEAAGDNGQLSRLEQRPLVDRHSGAERGLVVNLANFARYRFAGEPRQRLTVPRIERAGALAKERLVNAYAANRNGLSAAEMGRMRNSTRIGWLSVMVGQKLRSGAPLDGI